MSIYDRDYIRDEGRRKPAGGPKSWTIVTKIIAINVAVFVLNNLIFYAPDRDVFGLSLEALRSYRLWTPLTYQFVHADPWHLLGNMLGFYFLGRMLMDLTGARNVLRIYLLGGLAGGFLQLAWNAIFGPDAITIGASASVLAVIIAVATLIPRQKIQLLLFFILPVSLTLKQVAILLIAINAFTLFLNIGAPGGDGIAVMAHFGGILLGWAFVHYGFHQSSPKSRPGRTRSTLKERFGIRVIRDGEGGEGHRQDAAPQKRQPFVTNDVDAILDKINEQGFQSLTDEERGTLEQSSRKLSDRIDGNS